MMLTRLTIRNYKSLKAVDIPVPRFMTIVGANAAGKSNFVDALDFLRRCFRDGLNQAVGSKGGYENIAFRRARRARGALDFGVTLEIPDLSLPGLRIQPPRPATVSYRFAFQAHAESISSEYRVVRERFCCKWHTGEDHKIGFDRQKGVDISPSLEGMFKELWPPDVIHDLASRVPDDELVVPRGIPPFYLFPQVFDVIRGIGVFQISPRYAREPGDPSGRRELGRLGTNLPAVVEHLKKNNPKAFTSLLSRLKNLAQGFIDIETDYVETKHLGLFLREKGVGRRWYAADLSDGTVQTIALFTALLDNRFGLVAIEEPENSLHPWVIRQFVEAAREEAETRQVLLSTHSPYLVANILPEELFLAERNDGATYIVAATDVDADVSEIIQEGIMDLGEYWNSGQMSAVPGGESMRDLAERQSEGS